MSQVNTPGAPRLCVVLIEPAGPINLGSVARLCANYAINDLRLVAPRCDTADPEARRMAVHGQTVLESATHYPDLISALQGCRRVVATCGRLDHGTIPLHPPEHVLPWLLADHGATEASQAAAALVFGREDRGLSNDELLLSQRVISLYSNPHYPSLNLSHAVAWSCVWRKWKASSSWESAATAGMPSTQSESSARTSCSWISRCR